MGVKEVNKRLLENLLKKSNVYLVNVTFSWNDRVYTYLHCSDNGDLSPGDNVIVPSKSGLQLCFVVSDMYKDLDLVNTSIRYRYIVSKVQQSDVQESVNRYFKDSDYISNLLEG